MIVPTFDEIRVEKENQMQRPPGTITYDSLSQEAIELLSRFLW